MADKPQAQEPRASDTIATGVATGVATGTATPRRAPGHRGADARDTVAEMAARAQEISMEAGSKVAAAMKDVISAAAGLTGFVVESARDLVQYMVRRGQMTQDEADRIIRDAEDAQSKRKPVARAATPPRVVAVVPDALPAAPRTPKDAPAKPAPAKGAPARSAAPKAAAGKKSGTSTRAAKAPAKAAARGKSTPTARARAGGRPAKKRK